MRYEQPDFYRFNQDSFSLIRFIEEELNKKKIKAESILDIGSGSGVLGIELGNKIKNVKKVFFLEKQNEFKPSFQKNIKYLDEVDHEIFWASWKEFHIEQKVDLIVSNPPYYLEGSYRTSKIEQRQVCRSISAVSIKKFLRCALNHMHEKSVFFLCVKGWSHWEHILLEFKKHFIFKIKKEENLTLIAVELNKKRNKII